MEQGNEALPFETQPFGTTKPDSVEKDEREEKERPEERRSRRRRESSADSKSKRRHRDKHRRRSRSRERSRQHRSHSKKGSKSPVQRRRKSQFDVKPEITGDEEAAGAIVPVPLTTSVIPQDVLMAPEMMDPNGTPPVLYPGMGLPGNAPF